MYKKQLKFQRIICVVMLIVLALVFIYSLGIMTDLYQTLNPFVIEPSALNSNDPFDLKYATTVQGSRIVYDMQEFAGQIVVVAVWLIVLSLTLFVTCCQSRRNYYISNYVSIALVSVGNVVASIWALKEIDFWKSEYLNNIDFTEGGDYFLKAKEKGVEFIESTTMFDLSKLFFGLLLLATALLVANLIWKIILMKNENSLIKKGQEVKANV